MGQIRNFCQLCIACIICTICISSYLFADVAVPSCVDSALTEEEVKLGYLLDGHLDKMVSAINHLDTKCAKINSEFVRARVQIFQKQCIDPKEALEFVISELKYKFVDLSEYDLEGFIDKFYACSASDLLKKLEVENTSGKKRLPPRIECGIIASLTGYFLILLPIPPVVRVGWIVIGFGLELICEGYFQEQDRKYYEEKSD